MNVEESQLLTIFEETEQKIKRTVDGSTDPALATALVLYAATLLEASIRAIHVEGDTFTKMTCGVIRQTLRNTIGLETFMTMMKDDSMKAMDSLTDLADKKENSIYG